MSKNARNPMPLRKIRVTIMNVLSLFGDGGSDKDTEVSVGKESAGWLG